MDFPDGINGPDFSKGDLFSFYFARSTLSLRLPKIPRNIVSDDYIAFADWIGVSLYSWRTLVRQTLRYVDLDTYDNVAVCYLNMVIWQNFGIDYSKPETLNNQTFRQHVLNELTEFEKCHENDIFVGIETRAGWPSQKNEFYLESVERPVLNGLRYLFDLGEKKSPYPMPIARFVLDEGIHLRISLTLESLHYKDRKNPYSEELLHKLKIDLFEELLAHIKIEYNPYLVAQIEALNNEGLNNEGQIQIKSSSEKLGSDTN